MSNQITLVAERGREQGSRPSNRLRADGKIPGIVYGLGGESVAVAVDRRELRRVLSTDAGANALISLSVDGESQLAVIKSMQRHPVRHNVQHIDFLRVGADQQIEVEVPIELVGEAEQVERQGGLVEQQVTSLTVRCVPTAIPNSIVIDISAMSVGDTVRVADLALPEGASTDTDPDLLVVIGAATRASIAASGGEAGEDAADGAEGGEEA